MAVQIERIRTGIDGFDMMLGGGFPIGNQTAIAGGPGCGKSLICFEILYKNAKKGIPGAFIAFEETNTDILRNAKEAFPEFTDIDDLIAKKMLTVGGEDLAVRLKEVNRKDPLATYGEVIADIEKFVKDCGAKLVAIDSISLLKLVMSDGGLLEYRRGTVALLSSLRHLGVTSLLTIEMPSLERKDMKFTSEFFIFDGIVAMYQSETEQKRSYNLEIIKMRGTNHSPSFSAYEVTSRGFRVFASEQTEMF